MKKKIAFLLMMSLTLSANAQYYWQRIDSIVAAAIDRGVAPGAVLCIVHDNKIVHTRAFGNRQVYPDTQPMLTTTIFDLASLSKPTGTAMAVMRLIDEDKLSVDDKVSKYIPDFNDTVTVGHLLTHTSGLPAYANAEMLERKYGSPEPDSLMMHITMLSHGRKIGKVNYSCLNFITLQNIVQKITGMRLMDYYAQYIAKPLGLKNTTYCPPSSWESKIAPTENIKVGKREYRLLLGEVHDPLARIMNAGNSGNAGLFSNVQDLAKICIFLLNPDSVKGPFSAETVKLMTTIPDDFAESGRTFGWDSQTDYNAPNGAFFSDKAYCHSGYTGTSLAIDPERRVAVILLTNRVHPKDKGTVNPLRRAVANEVAMIYPLPTDRWQYVDELETPRLSTKMEKPKQQPKYMFIEPVKANKELFPDIQSYNYARKLKRQQDKNKQ